MVHGKKETACLDRGTSLDAGQVGEPAGGSERWPMWERGSRRGARGVGQEVWRALWELVWVLTTARRA